MLASRMRRKSRRLLNALVKIYVAVKRMLPLPGVKIEGVYPKFTDVPREYRAGQKIHLAAKREEILEEPPVFGLPSLPPLIGRLRRHENPPVTVAELEGFSISSRYLELVSPDGKIVEEYSAFVSDNRGSSYRSELLLTLKQARKEGCYASIMDYWANDNYYMWCVNSLTRLWALERCGLRDFKLLLPRALRPYHAQSLKLLGYDRSRIEYVEDKCYEVERLYMPSFTRKRPYAHREAIQWIRRRMIDGLPPAERSDGRRKLYLSRKNTRWRRLLNEEDLAAALHGRGFESVKCDQLSVAAQLRMFSQADCVVAVHGAALTNVAWMRPGTSVIEIYPQSRYKASYWLLANAAGVRYGCIASDTEIPSFERSKMDLTVNVADVLVGLERLAGRPGDCQIDRV